MRYLLYNSLHVKQYSNNAQRLTYNASKQNMYTLSTNNTTLLNAHNALQHTNYFTVMRLYIAQFANSAATLTLDSVAYNALQCAAQCNITLTHEQFCAAMLHFKQYVVVQRA